MKANLVPCFHSLLGHANWAQVELLLESPGKWNWFNGPALFGNLGHGQPRMQRSVPPYLAALRITASWESAYLQRDNV
jgi:hypothetical protein